MEEIDAGLDSLDIAREEIERNDNIQNVVALGNSSTDSLGSSHSTTRLQSAQILAKKYSQRDQVKERMLNQERSRRVQKQRRRRDRISSWQQKTRTSPFMVDLVAENQRIEEENTVRLKEEQERIKAMERKKQRVQNSILLKALDEASDLELLRQEKRVIQIEEKRLKALLDLEKAKGTRKTDLMIAKSAESRRKKDKAEQRRSLRKQEMEEKQRQYRALMIEKLGLDEHE